MPCLSELATLTEATQGTSIARFGHGELAIMNGMDANKQKYNPRLAEELRSIFRSSPCLVCVPHTHGKRAWEWKTFLSEFGKEICPNKWYGSAFMSREDEVTWPEGYKEFAGNFLSGAQCVSPEGENDYARVDELYTKALSIEGPIFISCGPTGTVLADRLARAGKWAVDIGNMRAFL